MIKDFKREKFIPIKNLKLEWLSSNFNMGGGMYNDTIVHNLYYFDLTEGYHRIVGTPVACFSVSYDPVVKGSEFENSTVDFINKVSKDWL